MASSSLLENVRRDAATANASIAGEKLIGKRPPEEDLEKAAEKEKIRHDQLTYTALAPHSHSAFHPAPTRPQLL